MVLSKRPTDFPQERAEEERSTAWRVRDLRRTEEEGKGVKEKSGWSGKKDREWNSRAGWSC
jgi:hypothetical protein